MSVLYQINVICLVQVRLGNRTYRQKKDKFRKFGIIPVNALTYRGLWIKGFVESHLSVEAQHNVIRAAQSRIYQEKRLNTGMFIRDSSKQLIAPDLLASATDYGQFYHWDYIFK